MSKDLFRFYTDNENLQQWLRSRSNQTESIEEILINFLTGKLIPFEELDTMKAIKAEELQYKKKRNIQIEKQNINLDYKNRIDKVRATYIETFGKEPTSKGEHAIKESVAPKPKFDEANQYFKVEQDPFSSNWYNLTCLVSTDCQKVSCHIDELKTTMIRHITNFHPKVAMKNE